MYSRYSYNVQATQRRSDKSISKVASWVKLGEFTETFRVCEASLVSRTTDGTVSLLDVTERCDR